MDVRRDGRKGERGGILILCAFSLIVLLLFVGLTIDFGLAYMTKASLGKAVDAAALTGARYVGQGQAQATAIAQTAFAMNYSGASRNSTGTAPVPTIAFSKDSLQNTVIQVNATATIKTYFLALVPAYKTLSVSASAQARYARVQMTLVLDRTGSMKTNAPGNSLQDAAINFVNQWDNTSDSLAEISFANDSRLDYPMHTGGFQQPITNSINAIQYQGDTYSDGALQLAFQQEQLNLGLTGNIIHVVVFFTDGNANTVQNQLICTGGTLQNPKSVNWNIGGFDPQNGQTVGTWVGFITPNIDTGSTSCSENNSQSCCTSTFPSTLTGTQMPINWTNVNADALNRAVQDANTMRANNIFVYAIGLHPTTGGVGVLNTAFLCQIANDPCPAYGGNTSYNANLPVGEFILVTDSSGLSSAFQQVANDIHLRLLQ
jgi:Flp pilus assembly protein TadG